MSAAGPDRSAVFYDRIAPDYDSLMARDPGNTWVRGAFLDLVCTTVPRGSLLLDFGCGTGTDARWYVERGYRVLAYDSSAGMIEELTHKAAREIADGSIVPICAPSADFVAAVRSQGSPQAVVANFAVLNLIQNLEPTFRDLAGCVVPSGWLIANVVNPCFWRDMVRPTWWRSCLQARSRTYVACPGDDAPHYRHFISRIVEAARPEFARVGQAGVGTFLRYGTGHYAWDEPRSLAQKADRRCWKSFPVRTVAKFVFLVFQRVS